jgi:hypothetical protein
MLRRLIVALASFGRAKPVAQLPPVADVLTRARARPGGPDREAIVAAVREGRDRD